MTWSEFRTIALSTSVLLVALLPASCASKAAGAGTKVSTATREPDAAAPPDGAAVKQVPANLGNGGPCGNDAVAAGAAGSHPELQVDVLSYDPTMPAIGDNTWTLGIRDGAGRPITGATLTATELMPAHGHSGPNPVVIRETGNGVYALTMNFNMPGQWQTTVRVETPTLDSQFILDVSCVR